MNSYNPIGVLNEPTPEQELLKRIESLAPSDGISGISEAYHAFTMNGKSPAFHKEEKERQRFRDLVQNAIYERLDEMDSRINALGDELGDLVKAKKKVEGKLKDNEKQQDIFSRFLAGEDGAKLAKENPEFAKWYENTQKSGKDPHREAAEKLLILEQKHKTLDQQRNHYKKEISKKAEEINDQLDKDRDELRAKGFDDKQIDIIQQDQMSGFNKEELENLKMEPKNFKEHSKNLDNNEITELDLCDSFNSCSEINSIDFNHLDKLNSNKEVTTTLEEEIDIPPKEVAKVTIEQFTF